MTEGVNPGGPGRYMTMDQVSDQLRGQQGDIKFKDGVLYASKKSSLTKTLSKFPMFKNLKAVKVHQQKREAAAQIIKQAVNVSHLSSGRLNAYGSGMNLGDRAKVTVQDYKDMQEVGRNSAEWRMHRAQSRGPDAAIVALRNGVDDLRRAGQGAEALPLMQGLGDKIIEAVQVMDQVTGPHWAATNDRMSKELGIALESLSDSLFSLVPATGPEVAEARRGAFDLLARIDISVGELMPAELREGLQATRQDLAQFLVDRLSAQIGRLHGSGQGLTGHEALNSARHNLSRIYIDRLLYASDQSGRAEAIEPFAEVTSLYRTLREADAFAGNPALQAEADKGLQDLHEILRPHLRAIREAGLFEADVIEESGKFRVGLFEVYADVMALLRTRAAG